jgi:hypothetical protein
MIEYGRDLDVLQEIDEDDFLLPLELMLATIEDLYTGDILGKSWISRHLYPHDAQGNLEVGREPGLISVSTGEQVFFGQIPLICLTSTL